MSNMRKTIESLINKSAEAEKSDDAMKFAQAALNAANAVIGMDSSEREDKR